jgi:GNAT superfamily N-acetyltransferase
MCEEWMKPLQLSIPIEQFHQLPRNPAFKYEYFDGKAWLSPRPRFFHGLLNLASLETRSLDWIDPNTSLRPLNSADWDALPELFAAAFRNRQPFGALTEPEWPPVARRCLERTRTGGDGPWIEQASFLAFRPEGHRPIGAILITLLPDGDPANQDNYFWREQPPADYLTRRIGRPHLTWIFVHPFLAARGVGTTLLNAAGKALLQLGYRELATTFLLGNDSSMLWHWRNGFRLLTHPGSWRPPPGSVTEQPGL